MGHCFTQRCGRCHPEQPGRQRNLTRCEELKFEIHHIHNESTVSSCDRHVRSLFLHHRIYLAPAISSPRTSPYLGIFTWNMGSFNRHLSGDIPKKTRPRKIIVFAQETSEPNQRHAQRLGMLPEIFVSLTAMAWFFWHCLSNLYYNKYSCIVFEWGTHHDLH